MSAPPLIIASIELPVRSRLDLQQTFELLDGGSSRRRMAIGALHEIWQWERWRTTISGSGWIPPQLLGINYRQPYQIQSVAPLAFAIGEPLPATWQSRAAPWAEKIITDEHGISVRLIYPILTVCSRPPRMVTGSSEPSWELTAEEP